MLVQRWRNGSKEVKCLAQSSKEMCGGDIPEPHIFLNESFITVGILLGRWLELWIAAGTLPCRLDEFSS